MGKNKPLEPQINDWLFSCSMDMKVEHIAATLEVTDQPGGQNIDYFSWLARTHSSREN